AIDAAKNVTAKPTIIEVRTEIGYGAPNAGTSAVHGAPLGTEGTETAKKNYNWTHNAFEVPEEVYNRFQENFMDKGVKAEEKWGKLVEEYVNKFPELGEELKVALSGELPKNWEDNLPSYEEN